MPLYDYDCPACGEAFEKRVSIADADHARCPRCGAAHTKRRLSRVAIKGASPSSASANAAPVAFAPGGT